MKIVQITPGAGGMYCGGCFHDNALVTALRQQGHDTLMIPLYLPLTLDEPDQSATTPVFFGGISVYLEQKLPLFRYAPRWVRHLLASRAVLKWAAGRAAKTRAEEVGELTLSMLRGEEGRQACELEDLVQWLRAHGQPDVVCLSNAMLIGMARRLRAEARVPVVCLVQGEDSFLDGLPPTYRDTAWQTLAGRAADVAGFVAPSHYYARRMAERLKLPPEKMHVVPDGIHVADFGAGPGGDGGHQEAASSPPPVVGYFSRMCPEKGLDTLVEAFVRLKQRPGLDNLRLHVGGGCGPGDEPFVARQRQRLAQAGVAADVQFFPNVDRAGKVRFFAGLTVFSVPALYGEAFGLYLLEALAAGVPVVQPRHAAFPEIIELTGGGVLCEPGSAPALADALEALLRDPVKARQLGQRGQQMVRKSFTADGMAQNMMAVFENVVRPNAAKA